MKTLILYLLNTFYIYNFQLWGKCYRDKLPTGEINSNRPGFPVPGIPVPGLAILSYPGPGPGQMLIYDPGPG